MNRKQDLAASALAIELGVSSEEKEAAAEGNDYYENIEQQITATRARGRLLEAQLENHKIMALMASVGENSEKKQTEVE